MKIWGCQTGADKDFVLPRSPCRLVYRY